MHLSQTDEADKFWVYRTDDVYMQDLKGLDPGPQQPKETLG